MIGGTNSDGCPSTFFRIETEAACETLAAIAGANMYAGSEEYSYYPIGCFWHTVSGKVYWNTHVSGASNSFAKPLCAGPPHAHTAALRAAGMRTSVAVPTRLIISYSGTQGSGETRVLSNRVVLGFSVLRRYSGGTPVISTQAVLRYSVLRQYSVLST